MGGINGLKWLKPRLNGRKRLAVAPITAVVVTLLSWTGCAQLQEWALLDQFFRLRPLETVDTRILVVVIDDSDITQIGRWPIPDQVLAQGILNLKELQPRVIALDLYRDLPVQPGHERLKQIFQSTANLIGVEKQFGDQKVPAPPALAQLNQVALADLVEDDDRTVRRGLISAQDAAGQVHLSLGAQAALMYLAVESIAPRSVDSDRGTIGLGQATFTALNRNDGGYLDVDSAGYQVLMNYRGPQERFQTISLSDVLAGKLTSELVRDRVVFIGSTAASINDFFLTPYNGSTVTRSTRTPGVIIHANLTSQMISAALEGRPLIQTVPEPIEWIWTLLWSTVGVIVTRDVLRARWLGQQFSYISALISMLFSGGALCSMGYLLFLGHWWIPLTPALMGLTVAAVVSIGLHNHQLQRLAYFDGLTKIANRQMFDQRLIEHLQSSGDLSLILCDIDYFKNYNDTYGHLAGDACLKQVATTIHSAVRRADLVARYGGEEFAIILPNTGASEALQIAERILHHVRELRLPHAKSKTSEYVTLSCGIASVAIAPDGYISPSSLLKGADDALYRSKRNGRDRVTLNETATS